MRKAFLLALLLVVLPGCGRLTGYNLKATVGQTQYDDGRNTIYTGTSIDAHFDVK